MVLCSSRVLIGRDRRAWIAIGCLVLSFWTQATQAFVVSPRRGLFTPSRKSPGLFLSSEEGGYSRQQQEVGTVEKVPLYPKAGDIVRWFNMDGGRADGEVLVGKISFIQKQLGQENKWLVELTELDDVGDGYYAEYPSRQRSRRKSLRPLEDLAPISASFVRSENAFKVPRTLEGLPSVRAKQYDIEGYLGPVVSIDETVVKQDGEVYQELKFSLIRNAAIAGIFGTIVADLVRGTQDAIIYAAGAAAGVGYLFFLSIKTDTVGSQEAKLGNRVSNLRFVLPVCVIAGVALYNKSLGDSSPISTSNPFETITPEQYAAAVIGFLTYRVPLFLSQLKDFWAGDEEEIALPGSVGAVAKMAQDTKESPVSLESTDALTPILLVSGPKAAGRSSLVERLIAESGGRFVEPKRVDAIKDGATFERIQNRDEFLQVDPAGRYGFTKDGVLSAGTKGESVVVVDADVDLAKKLTRVAGARLIGVWVGLDSVDKFESQIKQQIQDGEIMIPPDETEESVIRAKVREIVKDIEYGIVSGVFEFTILNNDPDDSVRDLKAAAEYCFS